MQNISRENADIIGEVANICIGNAATTLSMILQKPTNITTPIVEVLKKEDALDHDDRILRFLTQKDLTEPTYLL